MVLSLPEAVLGKLASSAVPAAAALGNIHVSVLESEYACFTRGKGGGCGTSPEELSESKGRHRLGVLFIKHVVLVPDPE